MFKNLEINKLKLRLKHLEQERLSKFGPWEDLTETEADDLIEHQLLEQDLRERIAELDGTLTPRFQSEEYNPMTIEDIKKLLN